MFPFRYGTYPLINAPLTGAETETVTNKFFNVYELLLPVCLGTNSQKYRRLMVQPQAVYSSVAAAQAEEFKGISLGNLTSPEYVAYTRLTFKTSAGDNNAGKCRLMASSYVLGTRANQSSITVGILPTAENIKYTPLDSTDTSTTVKEGLDSRQLIVARNAVDKEYTHTIAAPGDVYLSNNLNVENSQIIDDSGGHNITIYPPANWPDSGQSGSIDLELIGPSGTFTWHSSWNWKNGVDNLPPNVTGSIRLLLDSKNGRWFNYPLGSEV